MEVENRSVNNGINKTTFLTKKVNWRVKCMKNDIRQRNRSIRLTFSYEGSDVRMVSKQSVEMVAPPSDPILAQENKSGFWYELRDAEGKTIYRRVIQNPIKFAFEVRSDPERPLAWQTVSQPRGSFVLLLPELEQAKTLVLFSSPLEPKRAFEPAKELTRFSLEQVPDYKRGVR